MRTLFFAINERQSQDPISMNRHFRRRFPSRMKFRSVQAWYYYRFKKDLDRCFGSHHVNPHQLSDLAPWSWTAWRTCQIEWNIIINESWPGSSFFRCPHSLVQRSGNEAITSRTFIFHSYKNLGCDAHFNAFFRRMKICPFHRIFRQIWELGLQCFEINFFQRNIPRMEVSAAG